MLGYNYTKIGLEYLFSISEKASFYRFGLITIAELLYIMVKFLFGKAKRI